MRLRVADGIGVEEAEGIVYAAPLPDGPITVLGGVAGLIWTEACRLPRTEVAAAVARRTEQQTAAVRTHVDDFLNEMVGRGLLAES